MLPILLETSWITLFSYPLLMGMAWGLGYNLCRSAIHSNGLQEKGFNLFFLIIFLFSWVGSKLMFIAASANSEFENHAFSSNFWLGGGFVFLGGVLGGLFALMLVCLVFKKYPLRETVYFLPALAFAHALGRVGCFLAGCCYGTQCDLPWAIHLHGAFRHPVQLYEAITVFILGVVLLKISKRERPEKKLLNAYFGTYLLLRFILEFFRGDKIRGEIYSMSTSQLLSLLLLGGLFSVNIYLWKKEKN